MRKIGTARPHTVSISKRRWAKYAWILPVLWLPHGILLLQRPGDKGIAGYFGTLPGAWLPQILSTHGQLAFYMQTAGVLIALAIAGALLDWLRTSLRLIYVFITIGATCAAVAILAQDDASPLLGSWLLYLATTLAILWGTARLLIQRAGIHDRPQV